MYRYNVRDDQLAFIVFLNMFEQRLRSNNFSLISVLYYE